MKKNPKSPSLKIKRRQARARRVAFFKRTFFGLTLIVAGILFYFRYSGLPMSLVEPPLETLKDKGLELTWSHAYISVFKGLVFHDAELIIHEGLVPLVARVEKISISVNPFKMRGPSRGLRDLSLEKGSLEIDLTDFSAEPGKVFRWQFEVEEAALALSDDGYELKEAIGETCGMRVEATGTIQSLKEAALQNLEKGGAEGLPIDKIRSGGQALTETLRWIEQVQFAGEPKLNISFLLDRVNPELNVFDVQLQTRDEYVVRGMGFESLDLKAHAADGQVTIEEFESGIDGGAFQVGGSYRWATRELEGRVYCDVDPQYIQPLLPVALTEGLQKAGFTMQGEVVADFQVPRTTLDQLGQKYFGSLQLLETEVRNMWVEELSVNVSKQNQAFALTGIEGRLGKGKQAGPVSGYFNLNLDDKLFSAHLETGCAPAVLVPGVKGPLQNILRAFEVSGAPPECVLDFSARAGVKGTLVLEGQAKGEELAYRGVPLLEVDTSFSYSNGVVRLPDLFIERREGEFDGLLEIDLLNKMVTLDAVSTVNPTAAARMVSPAFENILRPFEFKGDSFVKLLGRYDYGQNKRHDLKGSMYVEDAGPARLLFEDCYFHWEARENVFTFADVRGMVEGGPFSGYLQFMELDALDGASFFIDLGVDGADLERITGRNLEGKENPYSGYISMRMDLEGRMVERWPDTLKGQGELMIEEGQLFRMPLLGGLSKLLSKIIPGFGFASQTEFMCEYGVGDAKVYSDNIALEGTLLSVKGHGDIGFDRKLNIKVQVKPLRDGIVADVVRTVFFPISKLFEFKLGGTLDKPEWRPDNLPKEMFFIFD